jgi:hypothetical protein
MEQAGEALLGIESRLGVTCPDDLAAFDVPMPCARLHIIARSMQARDICPSVLR